MALISKDKKNEILVRFPLVRVLFYERWFRVAFAAFLLVFVFLGLFLPKIWRMSPAGFLPIVKVSGLDLVQAWSLKRTALKDTAAGKFDEAVYAWQAALANNAADPGLVRGSLQTALLDPKVRQHANQALQQAFWLLRLTNTNATDVALACQVFERFRYYEPITELFEARSDQLPESVAASYLKALFNLGQMSRFDKSWVEQTKRFPKMQVDPELRLYRAAYLLGWGPPETMTKARQELQAATENPERRLLAYQLKLSLSANAGDVAEYGRVLNKLAELHEDTFLYHVGYWRLLQAAGKKDEAKRLVQAYSEPPSSPIELVQLAELFWQLGEHDQALGLFDRYVNDFGHAPMFWIAQSKLLVEGKQWDKLRDEALNIRAQNGIRDALGSYSYLLEAQAQHALGREADSLAACQKAADRECPYPNLSLGIASQLLQLDHPQLARQVLSGLEKPMAKELSYWLLLFQAGDRLKDADLMVKAGAKAYALAPNDARIINNYAAALLIARQNPDQAIKLTVQLLSANPESLVAVVNHGAALLMNDRPVEAEELLHRVRTNVLNRTQLTLYKLDQFEAYLRLHQYDRAWSVSDQIETDLLYPTQQHWLKQARQQLPPRQKQG